MKKFTLIELLTVMTVIAILVTMLLPSLTKVRKAAKATVCTNQQKQIVTATYAFLKKNNTKFPMAVNSGYNISWDDELSSYDGPNLPQSTISSSRYAKSEAA